MAVSKQGKVLIISAGLLLLAGSVVGVGAVTSIDEPFDIEESQTEECHHEGPSDGHGPVEDSDETSEPGKCLGEHSHEGSTEQDEAEHDDDTDE